VLPSAVTYLALYGLAAVATFLVIASLINAHHQRWLQKQQGREGAAAGARRGRAVRARERGADDAEAALPAVSEVLPRARALSQVAARLEDLAEMPEFLALAGRLAQRTADRQLVRLAHGVDDVLVCLAYAAIAERGREFGELERVVQELPLVQRVEPTWFGLRAVAACGPEGGPWAGKVLRAWAQYHENLRPWSGIVVFREQLREFFLWRAGRGDPFVFAPEDYDAIEHFVEREDLDILLEALQDDHATALLQSLRAQRREAAPRRVARQQEREQQEADGGKKAASARRRDHPDGMDDDPRTVSLASLGRVHAAPLPPRPQGPVVPHPALAAAVDYLERQVLAARPRSCLIVGEPGTGRRTAARLLIERLVARQWCVLEAGHADLIAGQIYIGALESRMQEYHQALGEPQRLWYVPDLGALEFTGRHRESPRSVLDLVLPWLENGDVRLVGVVAPAALQRLHRKWPQLRDAVPSVSLGALDPAATEDLARRWFAARTGQADLPAATAGALRDARLLAGQFLRDRAAPGNLFSLLTHLVAQREIAGTALDAPVARGEVLAALGDLTGLPPFLLDDRERLDPGRMRAFFADRIVGQAEAVECLVQRVALMKAGLTDPDRPQGVFLFAGPTGTGKTEIAKALAEFLFGSPDRLARLDLSEYAAPGAAQRLLDDGEAAAWSGDGDSLAGRIRRQPFSVVLLDEFEKAHPEVWNLFLQVFDDGRLTDARGTTTDFRHTIIVMTSNLGVQPEGGRVGFGQTGAGFRPADVERTIARVFRPEFRNRIDRTVVFRPFTREVMREILELELAKADRRRGLEHRDWAIVWDASATEFLLDRGFTPELGARPLRRAIERHLLEPLAELIASGRSPSGDQFVFVEVDGDRLATRFVDPDADEAAVSLSVDGWGGAAPAGGPDGGALPAELTPAAIAADPHGTPEELAALQRAHAELAELVAEPDWAARKEGALAAASADGFWDDPARFMIFDRIERLDRIEHGVQAAGRLLERLIGAPAGGVATRSRREPPRDLVARLADELRLLEAARLALAVDEPWDALLQVDLVGPPQRQDGAEDWADRLVSMYRRWARERRARLEVLVDQTGPRAGGGGVTGGWRWMAAVSGLAAWSVLREEDGQHVWEEPDGGGQVRVQARVRVEPRPVAADGDATAAAAAALGGPSPGSLRIVRVYRAEPSPLVRDRLRGWRSGRLERVLAGHFDLEGASRMARRTGAAD